MSYLIFLESEKLPKTSIYTVLTKGSRENIGEVKWYPQWREYCFFPESKTVWSRGCLDEIHEFMKRLMRERKEAKEVKT